MKLIHKLECMEVGGPWDSQKQNLTENEDDHQQSRQGLGHVLLSKPFCPPRRSLD